MSADEARTSNTGRIGGWLALVSTAVTILLTAANAYWSRESEALNTQLKQREQELKQQQIALDASKDKLARYTFVQTAMTGILAQDRKQKVLTVNLVSLALTPDEAQTFFAGLEASDDAATREVGTIGTTTVALGTLVSQLNDAVKTTRLGAVDQLIKDHKKNSAAVDQAIKMLEPPQLDSLSASGRINVLVFLVNTDPLAWSTTNIARAEAAVSNIRSRSGAGVQIGQQTNAALERLSAFIGDLKS